MVSTTEMNQLRPGDYVYYEVGKTRTLGRVLSIWRDSHLQIKWGGGKEIDVLMISAEEARYLRKK